MPGMSRCITPVEPDEWKDVGNAKKEVKGMKTEEVNIGKSFVVDNTKHDDGSERATLYFRGTYGAEQGLESNYYRREEYRHATIQVHGVQELNIGRWKRLNDTTETKTITVINDRLGRKTETKINLFRPRKRRGNK